MLYSIGNDAVTLALFDLDNTLLAGDSDHAWGEFLVELGVVDARHYADANQKFYDQYLAGDLDIYEFCRFAFQPLKDHPQQQLESWRQQFLQEKIQPMLLDHGICKIQWHRARNDTPVIITATNTFVTELIAQALDVEHLIATQPEVKAGRFTGEIEGIPCFQGGKVKRLEAWMQSHDETLNDSWFYSDSHNDLALLEKVTHPVAVDPDPLLRAQSEQRGWKILSFRGTPSDADCALTESS